VLSKDYAALEQITFEPDCDLQSFVDAGINLNLSSVERWTNTMIEDLLDRPFFRWSMFNNYLISS
jgi:hypothetical protein